MTAKKQKSNQTVFFRFYNIPPLFSEFKSLLQLCRLPENAPLTSPIHPMCCINDIFLKAVGDYFFVQFS